MNSIPGENRELDALVNQPKETHKGVTCLALTFGTLLSSQGTDARDTRPAGPSIAAAVLRYAARCVRQVRVQDPRPTLGAAAPGATDVPRAVFPEPARSSGRRRLVRPAGEELLPVPLRSRRARSESQDGVHRAVK